MTGFSNRIITGDRETAKHMLPRKRDITTTGACSSIYFIHERCDGSALDSFTTLHSGLVHLSFPFPLASTLDLRIARSPAINAVSTMQAVEASGGKVSFVVVQPPPTSARVCRCSSSQIDCG